MATIEIYNEIRDWRKKAGAHEEMDLGFLWIKMLVPENELVNLSETEQRNHERENHQLMVAFGDNKSDRLNRIRAK